MVFEIIPVIDIMQGMAVAGKCGEREKYAELKTVYAESSNPIEIAKNLPFKKIYIADLDAIAGKPANTDILRKISEIKEIWADLGIRTKKDVEKYSFLKVKLVLGTETLQEFKRINLRKYIVSVDIKNNKVISPFLPEDVEKTLDILISKGVKKIILLNISKVGTLKGNEYLDIGEKLAQRLEVYLGGGITKKDIEEIKKKGFRGALIGTALHRGLI